MNSNRTDNLDRDYELVLKGGTVIDPVQGLHSEMDIALKTGKIAAIQEGLNTDADRSIDVTGRLVVAGLIDLHTHVFWGG